MKRARAREADRLGRLLAAAEKDRATRFAAATRGTPAEVLGTVSEREAGLAVRALAASDLAGVALPGYLPLPSCRRLATMPTNYSALPRGARKPLGMDGGSRRLWPGS
ncbi:hypothetical protein [Streptomyces sp. NPDC051211]|uniref:hypothetical protein n=1 Tax=Streptomyces sp. NPDC051211 TaxID=3154643 RepID=UPI00344EACA5